MSLGVEFLLILGFLAGAPLLAFGIRSLVHGSSFYKDPVKYWSLLVYYGALVASYVPVFVTRDESMFISTAGQHVGCCAFLAGPLLGVYYLMAERIKPKNTCTHCGYKLVGLREARCPECGRSFDIRILSYRDQCRILGDCPKCSTKTDWSNDVCDHCGESLEQEPQSP